MRFAILCLLTLAGAAHGEPLTLAPVSVTEWKAVYGRIEARDRIPARARLGGTLTALDVAEGDLVTAGQVLGRPWRRRWLLCRRSLSTPPPN